MKSIYKFFDFIIKRDLPWAILNQVILSLGAITIIVLLSNILGAHTFGRARFLTAVLAIFSFFSLPGVGPVILQRIPVYSVQGFKKALLTQINWGLGASVGAVIFALVYYFQGDFDLARAFFVSGLLAPIANLYLMPGTALAGFREFKKKTFYDGLIILAAVLGAGYGAVSTQTVFGTMLWYFGSQSVATVIGIYLVNHYISKAQNIFETNTDLNVDLDTKYGKQLTLFQIPFTLLPALEKVLMFFLLGPVVLATFIIAMLPLDHMRNAYRSVLQFFLLPQFRHQHKELKPFKHWFLTAFLLSFGSIVVIVAFAFLVLPFLFPDFKDITSLVLFSSVSLLAMPTYVYILLLVSEKRIDRLFSYSLATILVDILIFVLFTSLFGLYGAVFAKVLSSFIGASIALLLYRSKAVVEM